MRVAALYRYPVKGLSAEPLGHADLRVGETMPGDRRFALEAGPSGFDPAAPAYLPKTRFLTLMRDERLASLTSRFDEATATLTLDHAGKTVRFDLSSEAGRRGVEALLTDVLAERLRGPLRLLEAPGFSFSDTSRKVVSLINAASVREIETVIGARVDPLRFRGNILLDDSPAWSEFEWIDRELAAPSGLRLRVLERIERCAATNVDPQSGRRDLNIPAALMRAFGHVDCGVYAEVVSPGTLAEGDRFALAEA